MLLDAFGTLLDMDAPGPRLREELRRRGVEVGAAAAEAAFREEIAFYVEHHLEARDPASLERLRDRCAEIVAGALGIEGPKADAVRPAMLAAIRFRPHDDAAPALRALRLRGVRLVATSNWDSSLPEVLRAAGLDRLLDAVVTSATAGAAKPHPAIFRAALAAAGARPAEAVHVGDSVEHDVDGARAAGIRAVLLLRGDAPAPAGVSAIRSLEQLADVI